MSGRAAVLLWHLPALLLATVVIVAVNFTVVCTIAVAVAVIVTGMYPLSTHATTVVIAMENNVIIIIAVATVIAAAVIAGEPLRVVLPHPKESKLPFSLLEFPSCMSSRVAVTICPSELSVPICPLQWLAFKVLLQFLRMMFFLAIIQISASVSHCSLYKLSELPSTTPTAHLSGAKCKPNASTLTASPNHS